MAGQGLGRKRGQRWGHGQRAWLGDQFPIEDIGERTLNAVVDGAPAERGGQNTNKSWLRCWPVIVWVANSLMFYFISGNTIDFFSLYIFLHSCIARMFTQAHARNFS